MEAVLVFKTSVLQQKEVYRLSPLLNSLTGGKGQWNFDLEDCDNILRIATNGLEGHCIEDALKAVGYQCEELRD